MTRLLGETRRFPGWVSGLVQDAEPNVGPLGSITEGQNFAPQPAGLQRVRGGSRIVTVLHDDDLTPTVLTHTCLLTPFTPIGAIAVGWSQGRARHYAYRLTSDMAFVTGLESSSRTDLSAAPSTSWNSATDPARPIAAELFERQYIVDATTDATVRSQLVGLDSTGTLTCPTFAFAGGAATQLRPYCLEEYNGVLFIAGYGDEADQDRPEIVRHSYLASAPDDADGFDQDAYLILGAKGQRVTALRKGRGLLLAAKEHEFYRINGFGRRYPGWQYQVEMVQNTLGLGISNPHALTFAEGYWYGIGSQGPLRTDGYSVESLAEPRQRSWQGISHVETAWVAYHPDAKVILFGMHQSETIAGRSATYPWTVWVWDMARNVWQTDWLFGADLFMGTAVTTATAAGPILAPSSLAISVETTTGYTATWVNGDPTAQTEVWEQTGTGAWTLIGTTAPAVVTLVVTGRTGHTLYQVEVRHRKGGVTTVYSNVADAHTLIPAPSISHACSAGSMATVYITPAVPDCDVVYEHPPGTPRFTFPDKPATQFIADNILASSAQTVQAKSHDAAWPVPDSGWTQATFTCPPGSGPR